jgi:hypothetical protein
MRFVDPTTPYRKSGGMGHPPIRGASCRDLDRSSALSFVIPTEAKRSGGICSSLNQYLIRIEAPPSPWSSRANRLACGKLRLK